MFLHSLPLSPAAHCLSVCLSVCLSRWVDITKGKFELTEWHSIAQQWYRQKARASQTQDAPCMLRKGLPRAFPNLLEVKDESLKDGTQYRSRMFQCPPELVRGVGRGGERERGGGEMGVDGSGEGKGGERGRWKWMGVVRGREGRGGDGSGWEW